MSDDLMVFEKYCGDEVLKPRRGDRNQPVVKHID
jgi:hypothetical protein